MAAETAGGGRAAVPAARGRCLCGAVRFAVRGPLRGVVNCYCTQCRRQHGFVGAYTSAALADVTIVEDGDLRWYESSAKARRGFCQRCGSILFWRPVAEERLAISAGALDQPTGLPTIAHVYASEMADFGAARDEAPRYPGPRADAG